jgi:hypothetical protein
MQPSALFACSQNGPHFAFGSAPPVVAACPLKVKLIAYQLIVTSPGLPMWNLSSLVGSSMVEKGLTWNVVIRCYMHGE